MTPLAGESSQPWAFDHVTWLVDCWHSTAFSEVLGRSIQSNWSHQVPAGHTVVAGVSDVARFPCRMMPNTTPYELCCAGAR